MLSGWRANRKKTRGENAVTQESAASVFLTTAINELLTDYLSSHHYQNEDFIYCAQQVVRAAILWQMNTSPWRILGAPLLRSFFYTLLEDETDDEITTEAMANNATTGLILMIDILAIPTGYSDATLAEVISATGTALYTKWETSSNYHWMKEGLFATKASKSIPSDNGGHHLMLKND